MAFKLRESPPAKTDVVFWLELSSGNGSGKSLLLRAAPEGQSHLAETVLEVDPADGLILYECLRSNLGLPLDAAGRLDSLDDGDCDCDDDCFDEDDDPDDDE